MEAKLSTPCMRRIFSEANSSLVSVCVMTDGRDVMYVTASVAPIRTAGSEEEETFGLKRMPKAILVESKAVKGVERIQLPAVPLGNASSIGVKLAKVEFLPIWLGLMR